MLHSVAIIFPVNRRLFQDSYKKTGGSQKNISNEI